MKADISELIDNLNDKLTRKQLMRFIKMARPEIKSHYLSLMDTLKKQQWSQAESQAHQFKTAISLFSYTDFVLSLDQINEKNIALMETQAFQTKLEQHYQSLMMSIDEVLNHKNT